MTLRLLLTAHTSRRFTRCCKLTGNTAFPDGEQHERLILETVLDQQERPLVHGLKLPEDLTLPSVK